MQVSGEIVDEGADVMSMCSWKDYVIIEGRIGFGRSRRAMVKE